MPALSSTLALGVLALSQVVSAHSWVEQMQVIGANGTYIGDFGYPRGYVSRTDPAFTGYSDKWQLPSPDTDNGRTRITDKMLLCHPSQRTSNYTDESFPKLNVSPGAFVAARYLENGHVTQPNVPLFKPKASGTVYIFGTYAPSETETLFNVLSWTKDGKGGDQKGFLISSQNYDDGRCHQLNQAPISLDRQKSDGNHPPGQPTVQLEQTCESDFQIPADAPTGSLTIYWVWDWSTQPSADSCGKDEYYTTCSDVNVVDGGDDLVKLEAAPKVHTLLQQDPQTKAVSDWSSRSAVSATPSANTNEACSPTSAAGSSGGSQGAVQNAKPALPKQSSSSGTTSSIAQPSPTNQVEPVIVFRTFTITETAAPSSSTPVQAPPGRLRRHVRS